MLLDWVVSVKTKYVACDYGGSTLYISSVFHMLKSMCLTNIRRNGCLNVQYLEGKFCSLLYLEGKLCGLLLVMVIW